MVIPQRRHPEQPKSIDSTIRFIVDHDGHLVFFVEMKPSGHIRNSSARAAADEEMRERYEDLKDRIDIGKLYGMSALGSKVCFYKYDKDTGDIWPRVIRNEGDLLLDTAPACGWSVDIMTPEGEDKLRQIVEEIKTISTEI